MEEYVVIKYKKAGAVKFRLISDGGGVTFACLLGRDWWESGAILNQIVVIIILLVTPPEFLSDRYNCLLRICP